MRPVTGAQDATNAGPHRGRCTDARRPKITTRIHVDAYRRIPLTATTAKLLEIKTTPQTKTTFDTAQKLRARARAWRARCHPIQKGRARSFSSVSAGRLHTCAVRTNATVVCWGRVKGSSKTLRVSKTGRFTYRFLATPLSSGTVKLQSINKVKVGAKKRTIKLAAKQFTAPANAKAKVTFKLSKKHLNALKRARSVRFRVTVTLAGATFTSTLKLRAPKKQ